MFRHDAQQAVQRRADRAGQEVRGGPVQDVPGARQQKRLSTPEQEYNSSVAFLESLLLVNHLFCILLYFIAFCDFRLRDGINIKIDNANQNFNQCYTFSTANIQSEFSDTNSKKSEELEQFGSRV